jgi:hypothetical protein
MGHSLLYHEDKTEEFKKELNIYINIMRSDQPRGLVVRVSDY